MHEQSETVQDRQGRWINVYGKATPQAGRQLPGTPAYNTVDEAVTAAKERSAAEGRVAQPNQAGQPLPSFVPPTRGPQVDLLDDPDFVAATPEQKHAYLSNIESPGYDEDYAKAPPLLQQKYVSSLAAKPGIFGGTQQPTRMPDGSVMPQTDVQRALGPWAEPLGKILLATAGAAAGGPAAGRVTSRLPNLVPMLGRALGAGGATGATAEGTMGEKVAEGAKGAGWSLGTEGLLRGLFGVGNMLAGSSAGKRFLEGARPPGPSPATPASNPITSTTVLHDMGSQQPAGSAFAPKAIIDPSTGQAVSTIHAPVVERNLAAVSPLTPVPIGPAKDLLVQRTPTAGTPAVPESVLNRVLRSGAPAGVAQDPNAQTGTALAGWAVLNKILNAVGLGSSQNQESLGGRSIGRGG
jgi:hypothetical protein